MKRLTPGATAYGGRGWDRRSVTRREASAALGGPARSKANGVAARFKKRKTSVEYTSFTLLVEYLTRYSTSGNSGFVNFGF